MPKRQKNPKLSWYWVSSGDLEWLGKAMTEKEAITLALAAQPDAVLGALTEIHVLSRDATYLDSRTVLEDRGFTYKLVGR